MVGSKLVIVVSVARPDTVTTPLLLVMMIASSPLVALMTTVSGWPSGAPLEPRSTATCFTSVPVRSLTVMLSTPPRVLSWIRSTLLRSMVMLATSRNSVARLPLAEMVMFSLTLAPLNSSVSLPAWPSTVSLPSPGFQTKVSSPAPRCATSLPRPPMTRSLPALPVMVSSPSPPLITRFDHARLEPRSVDRVVASETVDGERVVGAFGIRDRHFRGEPVHRHRAAAAVDLDDIVRRRCH